MPKNELWAILGFDFFDMSGKDPQKFYMEVLRDCVLIRKLFCIHETPSSPLAFLSLHLLLIYIMSFRFQSIFNPVW